jgi:hypothetical protein
MNWYFGGLKQYAVFSDRARQAEKSINNGVRDGAVSGKSHENEAISGFPVPGRGMAGPFVGRWNRSGWKR